MGGGLLWERLKEAGRLVGVHSYCRSPNQNQVREEMDELCHGSLQLRASLGVLPQPPTVLPTAREGGSASPGPVLVLHPEWVLQEQRDIWS